ARAAAVRLVLRAEGAALRRVAGARCDGHGAEQHRRHRGRAAAAHARARRPGVRPGPGAVAGGRGARRAAGGRAAVTITSRLPRYRHRRRLGAATSAAEPLLAQPPAGRQGQSREEVLRQRIMQRVLGGVPMTAQDSMVQRIVERLDFENYKALIKGLTQFGDREQGTERNERAVDWIE